MLLDPLNDAMVTIRNAELAGKGECVVRPASTLVRRVLEVMREAGYLERYEFLNDGRGGLFRVNLKGTINDCGVIKPRFSVKRTELDKWEARYLPAQDFGVLILTTAAGVVGHDQAKQLGVGGKLLAYVY